MRNPKANSRARPATAGVTSDAHPVNLDRAGRTLRDRQQVLRLCKQSPLRALSVELDAHLRAHDREPEPRGGKRGGGHWLAQSADRAAAFVHHLRLNDGESLSALPDMNIRKHPRRAFVSLQMWCELEEHNMMGEVDHLGARPGTLAALRELMDVLTINEPLPVVRKAAHVRRDWDEIAAIGKNWKENGRRGLPAFAADHGFTIDEARRIIDRFRKGPPKSWNPGKR